MPIRSQPPPGLEHATIYTPDDEPSWYHFIHGDVPTKHIIDFIYRPKVPHGRLTERHFSHLSRLIAYLEPQSSSGFAFTIANLSRDDTQHEPGRGGIALILSLRARGATDNEARPDPPFAHCIVAVDRDITAANLYEAANVFHDLVIGTESSPDPAADFYKTLQRISGANPDSGSTLLRAYVDGFSDLPALQPSQCSKWWTTDDRRDVEVTIRCPPNMSFHDKAALMARLGALLYHSDLRWTSITTGEEPNALKGIFVRLTSESSFDRPGAIPIDEIPSDDLQLARRLFAAELMSAQGKFIPEARSESSTGNNEDHAASAQAQATVKLDAVVEASSTVPSTRSIPSSRAISSRRIKETRSPAPIRSFIFGFACGVTVGIFATILVQNSSYRSPGKQYKSDEMSRPPASATAVQSSRGSGPTAATADEQTDIGKTGTPQPSTPPSAPSEIADKPVSKGTGNAKPANSAGAAVATGLGVQAQPGTPSPLKSASVAPTKQGPAKNPPATPSGTAAHPRKQYPDE